VQVGGRSSSRALIRSHLHLIAGAERFGAILLMTDRSGAM
jgi:hypothetical protein